MNKFSYKTLEEMAADCRRRNLSIHFDEKIDILFESIEAGGRRIGNRLAIHPMEGSDGTPDGKPGELTFHRWRRFATGGAKLIWGEAAAVVPEGRSNPRQLIMSERNVPELAELVKHARREHREKFGTCDDLLIGIQLSHAGRHCFEKPAIAFRSPPHDAFAFLDKRTGERIPPDYPVVTDSFLETLEDSFIDAARAARDAGFDFVDIKQCHSYLLNELLAAVTRPGRYGGSLENRTRFVCNVVEKIHNALGNDILIASRLNVFDGIPFAKDTQTGAGTPAKRDRPLAWNWGTAQSDPHKEDLSEPRQLIEILISRGVGLLSVSAGSPYWSPHFVRPFSKPVEGGYISPEHPLEGISRLFRLTGEVQKAFPDVPVAGSGYSWLRQFLLNAGAANIAAGSAAIVGVGRTAIAYPDFAADAREQGGFEPGKACLADSLCSNMLRAWDKQKGEKLPAGCPVRDPKYRELYRCSFGPGL